MNANVEWHKAVRPITDLGASYIDGNGDLCIWSSQDIPHAYGYLHREATMNYMPVKDLAALRAKAQASNADHLPLNGYGLVAFRAAIKLGYPSPMGIEASLRALEMEAEYPPGAETVLEVVNSCLKR